MGLNEEDSRRILDAAHAVDDLPGARIVTLALPTEYRSMEPYVIEISASLEAGKYGYIAFCPLHQRPTSPVGQMGVEIGNVIIAEKCPGRFIGFYHPEGDEAAENWMTNHYHQILLFLQGELERTQKEIEERDFQQAPGSLKLSESEMDQVVAHWQRYAKSVEDWISKVESGEPYNRKEDGSGN